eukprot:TRINITY_DN34284_c0_g1_i1.p1 TRINITY_DN34284_c0_g1~~TRINITY_DN34284_c0_g1_i1.p1  ORF type:complete len:164 (-),score=11.01 TRINITY_DN34284_c0_g1_i1:83-574(-)
MSVARVYLERGPDCLCWLCFGSGACVTMVGLVGFLNLLKLHRHPLVYAVHSYQVLFGLLTCILEAPEDPHRPSEQLVAAHRFIYNFAKFLTTFGGRGIFYIFAASLTASTVLAPLTMVFAIYMGACGFICLACQSGCVPHLRPGATNISAEFPPLEDDYLQVY